MWWVTSRNIWAIYRLPSPLFVDEMSEAGLEALAIATEASYDMIQSCLDNKWDLSTLPKSFGTGIVLCYLAASNDLLHKQRSILGTAQGVPEVERMDKLEAIRHVLYRNGGTLARMLKKTQESLDRVATQLDNANDEASSNICPIGFAVAGIGVGSGVGGGLDTDLNNWFQSLTSHPEASLGGDMSGWGCADPLGHPDAWKTWPWPLLDGA